MSRIVMYRLWDTVNKKMIYAEEAKNSRGLLALGLHGLPIAVDADSFRDGEIVGWNIDHNVIPLQNTGLLDASGKEIYEGDIVKMPDARQAMWVEYQPPSFVMKHQTKSGGTSTAWSTFDLDYRECQFVAIIGNIWQHPELLEVPA